MIHGTAIYTTGPSYTSLVNAGSIYGAVNIGYGGITNSGLINGPVTVDGTCAGSGCPTLSAQASLLSAVPALMNLPGAVLQSSSVTLPGGTLANAGTFDVRAGGTGTAALTGNYHALAGGTLHVGADFAKGTADQLKVTATPSSIRAARCASTWRITSRAPSPC